MPKAKSKTPSKKSTPKKSWYPSAVFQKVSLPKIKAPKKYVLPVVVLLILVGLVVLAARFLVVAWVDKKPVTAFEYYTTLANRYGKDTREQLIVQKLVASEAQNRHVVVTDQEVDAQIKKITDSQGGQSQLTQVLQMQGIGQKEFRDLVRLQLLRQKMFSDGVNVSDDEVNKYIDANKQSLLPPDSQNQPVDAKTKQNVKDQLTQQKINSNFSSWLQGILNSNRVVRV